MDLSQIRDYYGGWYYSLSKKGVTDRECDSLFLALSRRSHAWNYTDEKKEAYLISCNLPTLEDVGDEKVEMFKSILPPEERLLLIWQKKLNETYSYLENTPIDSDNIKDQFDWMSKMGKLAESYEKALSAYEAKYEQELHGKKEGGAKKTLSEQGKI